MRRLLHRFRMLLLSGKKRQLLLQFSLFLLPLHLKLRPSRVSVVRVQPVEDPHCQ
jgi:hypothetical protein